jgi:hypothetical protein
MDGADMKINQEKWNWLESLVDVIPINYLLIFYIDFILLFSLYLIFSKNVILFEWNDNTWHITQSLAESFLIPYLMVGLIYFCRRTRDIFKYIDYLYGNCGDSFYNRIDGSLTGNRSNFLLFEFSLLIPFIILSWGQWPYSNWEKGNPWALGLDIFNYFLSFLILALISELLWLMFNIILSFVYFGLSSRPISIAFDIAIVNLRLNPLKNFFIIFILYYFLAVTLIIYTYASPSGKMSFEPLYFGMLLVMGCLLFFAGLKFIQDIIDYHVDNRLSILDNRRAQQEQILTKMISSEDIKEESDRIECISNAIEFIQRERDYVLQANRSTYNVASIGLFVSSFVIPLLTLLEKLELI